MPEETLEGNRHLVQLVAGSPPPADLRGEVVEIDCGATRLIGLDGLRVLLARLNAMRPSMVAEIAERRRSEWNMLFPEAFPDAAPLSALASTCSERRLHAESEQTFRVIVAAAQAVARAAERGPLTIVLRRAAWLDLPSMRAIPHLVERAAMTGVPLRLVLSEVGELPGDGQGECDVRRVAIRRRILASLIERLGGRPERGAAPSRPLPPTETVPFSRERHLLERLSEHDTDPGHTAEESAATAIGLMRAAFFSTDHDTGVLAAYRLLSVLDRHPGLDVARVRSTVESMQLGDDPGSVGVDAAAVVDHAALGSLAHRYLGMVHVFVLDYVTALGHLAEAVTLGPGFVRARARLLRALLLIKRVGDVPAGFAEVAAGMADLAGDTSQTAAVEAAWLHNVKALGHVQLREADAAMAEERAAVRLIGKLSTTDATHLKVNLVSNISVLREYARRYDAAVEVWRRFSRRSTAWGDTFFKHHAYREGGLLVRAGALEEAFGVLAESYRLASAGGDDFYCCHMALERGRLLWDRAEDDEATRWYRRAEDHAMNVGDPYLLALAKVGAGLTSSKRLEEDIRQEALALAGASLSYPRESERFVAALASCDITEVRDCLPAPRTKLNRPFFAVRMELRERV